MVSLPKQAFWDNLYENSGIEVLQIHKDGETIYDATTQPHSASKSNIGKKIPVPIRSIASMVRQDDYLRTTKGHNRPQVTAEKQCFRATVMIDLARSGCVKLTQALFDTGATKTSISRTVVQKYGLRPSKVEPMHFTIADGRTVIRDEIVYLDLYIAGVQNRIQAFVEDADRSMLMLIGIDVMDMFLMSMYVALMPKREWKWTVAEDITGLRSKRHVVEEDTSTGPARMFRVTGVDGKAWSRRHGGTVGERKEKTRRLKAARSNVNSYNFL